MVHNGVENKGGRRRHDQLQKKQSSYLLLEEQCNGANSDKVCNKKKKMPINCSPPQTETVQNECSNLDLIMTNRYECPKLPCWNIQSAKARFGGHTISRVQLNFGPQTNGGDNFLSYLTGNRNYVAVMPVDDIIQGAKIELQCEDEAGRVYELVSTKECEDSAGGTTLWSQKRKLLELFYMVTGGSEIPRVDPQACLSRFGNFAKLSTRKVVARLELFQSPGKKLKGQYVLELSKHSFVDIDENGHEGCGFIAEEHLYDIIGRKKNGHPTKLAISTLCIQVRVYIPSRGKLHFRCMICFDSGEETKQR